jgi:hypothetical protein
VDPTDGQAYDKAAFLGHYGGFVEWDAAATLTVDGQGGRRVLDAVMPDAIKRQQRADAAKRAAKANGSFTNYRPELLAQAAAGDDPIAQRLEDMESLQGMLRRGEMDRARSFLMMLASAGAADLQHVSLLARHAANSADLRALVDEVVPAAGLEPNVVLLTQLADMLRLEGDDDGAQDVVDRMMPQLGVEPDARTAATMMRGSKDLMRLRMRHLRRLLGQASGPPTAGRGHSAEPLDDDTENGGDWTCTSCRASNFRRRTECFKCGSPAVARGSVPERAIPADAGSDEPFADVAGAWNFLDTLVDSAAGQSLEGEAVDLPLDSRMFRLMFLSACKTSQEMEVRCSNRTCPRCPQKLQSLTPHRTATHLFRLSHAPLFSPWP